MADEIYCNAEGNPKLTGFTLAEFKRLQKREIVNGYFVENDTLKAWEYGHKWSMCPQCGPMIICGKCGNNCCNGGHGILADGSECTACNAAYDMQNTQYPGPLVWQARWWNFSTRCLHAWLDFRGYFWKKWKL